MNGMICKEKEQQTTDAENVMQEINRMLITRCIKLDAWNMMHKTQDMKCNHRKKKQKVKYINEMYPCNAQNDMDRTI